MTNPSRRNYAQKADSSLAKNATEKSWTEVTNDS